VVNIDYLDVRTKKTVQEGIVYESGCGTHDYISAAYPLLRLVDYQPGNGTRYWLSIIDTQHCTDEANKRLGFGDKTGYIITDLNRGRSMFLSDVGFIAAGYVQDKLECGISDAYVLAELLGYLLKREAEKAGP
jgi:hypothetical protein